MLAMVDQTTQAIELVDAIYRGVIEARGDMSASQVLSAATELHWAMIRLTRARDHLTCSPPPGPGYDA